MILEQRHIMKLEFAKELEDVDFVHFQLFLKTTSFWDFLKYFRYYSC